MARDESTHVSKFLSFVLRHEPHAIGIELDAAGWVDIDRLLEQARANGRSISRALLEEIVRTSPKQRFAISEDGRRIRASQGHSVEVDLGYEPVVPPSVLFHGTVGAVVPAILAEGLKKMGRHHVHLSAEVATAQAVGSRRGTPVVLSVAAARMLDDGHVFYLAANGVWLVDHVPAGYLEVLGG